MNDQTINTADLTITFGKHKGERWTRVPVSYLLWLSNTPGIDNRNKQIAEAELARRGTTKPDMDISGHAIDRASLECRAIWHETKLSEKEGLHSWLVRMASAALKTKADDKGRHHHQGMWFAFEQDGCWPVLKTVHREKAGG